MHSTHMQQTAWPVGAALILGVPSMAAGRLLLPLTGCTGSTHSSPPLPGCPVPGPAGWTQYRTEGGEAYYHNSKTQETT